MPEISDWVINYPFSIPGNTMPLYMLSADTKGFSQGSSFQSPTNTNWALAAVLRK